jgi:beta-mannosidase
MDDERRRLTSWTVASAPAGAVDDPQGLAAVDLEWLAMEAPGTAASALRAAGLWTDETTLDFDADDWWFRTTFDNDGSSTAHLRFEGIATLADVWLNGEHVLHSEDMFMANTIEHAIKDQNELVIVCRSVRNHLTKRRSRGRWKTRLVELQQLRWVRTCLLGRMPTWPPVAAPVGPWRPVEVLTVDCPRLDTLHVDAQLIGDTGVVEYAGVYSGPVAPVSARLVVGDGMSTLVVTPTGGGWELTGSCSIDDAEPWYPATHGHPQLYAAAVIVGTETDKRYDLGGVGFRTVAVDQTNGAFRISINETAIFCRGACWVPLDPVRLWSSQADLRMALGQMVDAGMNMVRITGTMVPEQDQFYELCDELGILVWHDMMFANMEYPIGDPDFARLIQREVSQLLERLRGHPCIAVVCGGSEVEQQAAMMGLDTVEFANVLGRSVLPALVADQLDGVGYLPCSPSGGVFPFSMSTGVSHYYGVSAYLRPLDDARRANIRFTTECLAFANVPCRQSVEEFLRDGERPGHAPRWKARVPRDRGTGWDFEDVRDHYVRTIFGADPMQVRYADPDRYLDLGRAATSIAIEATISEWRRSESSCDGALVFTMRDLVEGAGWGLIDAKGRPKAAYYAMARASAPLAVLLTDEGLNGLVAHVHNDGPTAFDGRLRARLFDSAGNVLVRNEIELSLAPRESKETSVDGMFDGFRDLTYAFRFGPLQYDVVSIQLLGLNDDVISEATHLPAGHARGLTTALELTATARFAAHGVEVRISTRTFAQWVWVEAHGWQADDNWFHLAPGDQRLIHFVPVGTQQRFAGEFGAFNVRETFAFAPLASEHEGNPE